ncbi:hypothetical protein [Methylobacterium sp. V23]|uniref:transposase n=1 Tax=Methylobacterium sp. V23 TaxID=2044878 RepID=UPI000CDAE119|nr:hypothetical protein [Methylobacterium sp. V23]POR40479.1 hypothetical protein CRT23_23590 [Methylobacterium sp. V23]
MRRLGLPDRCDTSHAFREHIRNLGARPAIPPRRHAAPVACPDGIDDNRRQVARPWAGLEEWRARVTRSETTAASVMGALCRAAARDGITR